MEKREAASIWVELYGLGGKGDYRELLIHNSGAWPAANIRFEFFNKSTPEVSKDNSDLIASYRLIEGQLAVLPSTDSHRFEMNEANFVESYAGGDLMLRVIYSRPRESGDSESYYAEFEVTETGVIQPGEQVWRKLSPR